MTDPENAHLQRWTKRFFFFLSLKPLESLPTYVLTIPSGEDGIRMKAHLLSPPRKSKSTHDLLSTNDPLTPAAAGETSKARSSISWLQQMDCAISPALGAKTPFKSAANRPIPPGKHLSLKRFPHRSKSLTVVISDHAIAFPSAFEITHPHKRGKKGCALDLQPHTSSPIPFFSNLGSKADDPIPRHPNLFSPFHQKNKK